MKRSFKRLIKNNLIVDYNNKHLQVSMDQIDIHWNNYLQNSHLSRIFDRYNHHLMIYIEKKIIIRSNKIETYFASVDLPEPEYKEKNKYHI